MPELLRTMRSLRSQEQEQEGLRDKCVLFKFKLVMDALIPVLLCCYDFNFLRRTHNL